MPQAASQLRTKRPIKQMGIPIPVKNAVPEIGSCIGSQQNVFMDDIDQHGTLCNVIYPLFLKWFFLASPNAAMAIRIKKRLKLLTHRKS